MTNILKYTLLLALLSCSFTASAASEYTDWTLEKFKSYSPASVGQFTCCAEIRSQTLISGKSKTVLRFERASHGGMPSQKLYVKTKQIESIVTLLSKHLEYSEKLEEQVKTKFGNEKVRVFSTMFEGKSMTVIYSTRVFFAFSQPDLKLFIQHIESVPIASPKS